MKLHGILAASALALALPAAAQEAVSYASYGGAYQDAKVFAARAQTKFKTGSPGWVRAQDIINYRQPGKKK